MDSNALDDVSGNVCRALRLGQLPRDPGVCARGRVVQVDPIKPKLKAPGNRRFEARRCFHFCFTFAFNFNLRRYTVVPADTILSGRSDRSLASADKHYLAHPSLCSQEQLHALLAGACTRPL
jgi:hypothetical protein